MSEPVVQFQTRAIVAAPGRSATITLNRPKSLNSISWEMLHQLDAAISKATSDQQIRVIFVTGAGRAFSAGGDLKKYIELQRDPVRFPKFVSELHRVFGRLRNVQLPTVALVNGVTAAGGLELLLNCDIVIAASSAQIGDGHLNYGQMGGGGVLTLLARTIGVKRAAQLILTGEFVDADTCASWGLVGKVVADEDLLAESERLATLIGKKSPLAVANAKYVMNTLWAEGASVEAGLRLELERNAVYCLTSEDAPEGLLAFSEKRDPRFTGK